jgi:hypothetical protein
MLLRCRFDASSQTSALVTRAQCPSAAQAHGMEDRLAGDQKQVCSGSATVEGPARRLGLTLSVATHVR